MRAGVCVCVCDADARACIDNDTWPMADAGFVPVPKSRGWTRRAKKLIFKPLDLCPLDLPGVDLQPIAREHENKPTKFEGQKRLLITADSGAGESVLPKTFLPEIACDHSMQEGQPYSVANGKYLFTMSVKRP